MRKLLVGLLLLPRLLAAQPDWKPLHQGWSFAEVGEDQWFSAQVPGEVHLDLLRNGRIPDPFFGSNVDSIQWVEQKDWVYRCTVLVTPEMLRQEHVELVFKGLDTFAEVRWNDSLIGKADNMFRSWEWPIEHLLRPGPNELKVVFRSAIKEGKERAQAFGITLPHDNDPSGVAPFVRKAAYQFGWDFVPRAVGCGIWKEVGLRCWSGARLDGLRVQQHRQNDSVHLRITAGTLGPQAVSAKAYWNDRPLAEGRVMPVDGEGLIVFSVALKEEDRWWPSGEGAQPLQILRLELFDREGRLMDLQRKRIGLRTLELVQEEDEYGRSFRFEVNGRPIFMKGANVVPPDLFATRCTDSAWVALVDAVRRANMNMLRVWGGGIHPPEAFFNACDSVGILVWQDHMFGNIPPGDREMLENIKGEVIEVTERLAHHPSLALLCGNNELDVAWHNWGWQQRYGIHGADSVRVRAGYDATFNGTMAVVANQYGIPFIGSSPLSNWGNAPGLRSGDLHYWGVWHADSAFSAYRNNVGRFVSEYGFQSYPEMALLKRYLPTEELTLGSTALRKRQFSYRKDRPILEAIQREFGIVPTDLQQFIAGSQAAQALGMREAIWWHRSSPGCQGSLLWQLNDAWPGPSWSILDHSGRPKKAFEEVVRAFSDVVVHVHRSALGWELAVLNHRPDFEALLEWRTDDPELQGRYEQWLAAGKCFVQPLPEAVLGRTVQVQVMDTHGQMIASGMFICR